MLVGLAGCGGDESDPSTEKSDESDTTVDTDTDGDTDVEPDTGPRATPPRWPREFTEIGESALCTQADDCIPEWITNNGTPNRVNLLTCTVGGYDGPTDTSTVCLFDYMHESGRRGDVMRYEPSSGSWVDLGSFTNAGINEYGVDQEIGWMTFVDIDGDGQKELLALVPGGPLLRKVGDQWETDDTLGSILTGQPLDIPGVVDLNRDGLLDIIMYEDGGKLRSLYQHPNGAWVEHFGATRFPGADSKAYDWIFHREEDSTLNVFSFGSRLHTSQTSDTTGVFVQTGVDTQGYALFQEIEFPYVPEPMGGHLLDLDHTGQPIVVAAGSLPDMCPVVALRIDTTWWDTSLVSTVRLPNQLCGEPANPAMHYIPWHIAPVDNQLLVMPTGDDARGFGDSCTVNPVCPEFEPLVGFWPDRAQGQLVALGQKELSFVAPDGADVRMGNRRFAKCLDIDQDGDADCALGGAYYGPPQLMRNDIEGPRTCFRTIGTGPTVPHHGGLARVKLEADGQTWYEWPNSSLSNENEVCVVLDGPLNVTIDWPDHTVSTHSWSPGDPTNWEAVQP